MIEYLKNPFTILFPPFAVGILFNIFTDFNIPYLFIFLIIFFFLLIVIHKLVKFKSYIFDFSLYIFLFVLGIYVLSINEQKVPEFVSDRSLVYEGIIVEAPKEKAKSIQCVVKLEAYQDSSKWYEISSKSVVYFQIDSLAKTLKYGDRVVFKGFMSEIKNAGNPAEFDYKTFMNYKGIFLTSYSKSEEFLVLERNLGNRIIRNALALRNYLLQIYEKYGINEQQFAVLSALTLGYKDEIDLETRQIFANTGAMHILAVSGLHVGIIFVIINSLLKFMDKKKYTFFIKSVLVILLLWIFAAIAGLSPSVCRSALMFSLVVIGKMMRRNSSIYNTIFASAFVLLLINPYDILNVGFLLSYMAVLSIVYFQPYIYKLFVFEKNIPDKIWALVSVSIAAQLGTMPLGFYYFHQFPNYFILTNILVIPLASIILYLAVILLVISFIPFLASFVAFLLKIILKFLLSGVAFIDSLPFSVIKDIYISPLQVIILYIVILSFFTFWIYNKKELLYTFLTSFLIFLTFSLIIKYKNITNNELIIYNTRKDVIINVLDGKNNTIFADTSVFSDGNIINFSIKPYWITRQVNEPQMVGLNNIFENGYNESNCFFKNNFFQIYDKKFLYLSCSNILKNQTTEKINIDYIILSQNPYIEISELTELFDFKTIVFDGSNKSWRISKWKEQCNELKINYFDITTQGAFSVSL